MKRKKGKGSDSDDDFRYAEEDSPSPKRQKKPAASSSSTNTSGRVGRPPKQQQHMVVKESVYSGLESSESDKEADKYKLPEIPKPSPFELPLPKNARQKRSQEFCFECGKENGGLVSCSTCVGKDLFFFLIICTSALLVSHCIRPCEMASLVSLGLHKVGKEYGGFSSALEVSLMCG